MGLVVPPRNILNTRNGRPIIMTYLALVLLLWSTLCGAEPCTHWYELTGTYDAWCLADNVGQTPPDYTILVQPTDRPGVYSTVWVDWQGKITNGRLHKVGTCWQEEYGPNCRSIWDISYDGRSGYFAGYVAKRYRPQR